MHAFDGGAFDDVAFDVGTTYTVVPTYERFSLRRSKYNVYIPDDIPIEEALLLWWQMINSVE